MTALNIFSLYAARATRHQLEQLAGVLQQDSTATAAMRQQVSTACTEINDVLDQLERMNEPTTRAHNVNVVITGDTNAVEINRAIDRYRDGLDALPTLPRRVRGATLS